MTKYKFLFYGIIGLFLLSILYPVFHNEKSLEMSDDLKFREIKTQIVHNQDTTNIIKYQIVANDTSYFCERRVIEDLKSLEYNYLPYNYDAIALFNDDGLIRKIYHSRNTEFISYFSFNKVKTFWIDTNSGYFAMFMTFYIIFIIVLLVIYFMILDLTGKDIYWKVLYPISSLLILVITSYLYMYFETPTFILIIVGIGSFYYFKIVLEDDVYDDYVIQKKVAERIKNKKDKLKRNFNTLIK